MIPQSFVGGHFGNGGAGGLIGNLIYYSLFSSPVLYKRERPARLILGDPRAACREIESCNSGKTWQK